jgi:hypothetical protein
MFTKKSSSLSWGLSVCLSVRQKLPGCEENKLHSNPKPRKTQISPCLIWSPDFFISCKCTRSSVPWEVLLKKSHTPNPPTHNSQLSHFNPRREDSDDLEERTLEIRSGMQLKRREEKITGRCYWTRQEAAARFYVTWDVFRAVAAAVAQVFFSTAPHHPSGFQFTFLLAFFILFCFFPLPSSIATESWSPHYCCIYKQNFLQNTTRNLLYLHATKMLKFMLSCSSTITSTWM